jgi:hypothetical protein
VGSNNNNAVLTSKVSIEDDKVAKAAEESNVPRFEEIMEQSEKVLQAEMVAEPKSATPTTVKTPIASMPMLKDFKIKSALPKAVEISKTPKDQASSTSSTPIAASKLVRNAASLLKTPSTLQHLVYAQKRSPMADAKMLGHLSPVAVEETIECQIEEVPSSFDLLEDTSFAFQDEEADLKLTGEPNMLSGDLNKNILAPAPELESEVEACLLVDPADVPLLSTESSKTISVDSLDNQFLNNFESESMPKSLSLESFDNEPKPFTLDYDQLESHSVLTPRQKDKERVTIFEFDPIQKSMEKSKQQPDWMMTFDSPLQQSQQQQSFSHRSPPKSLLDTEPESPQSVLRYSQRDVNKLEQDLTKKVARPD